MTNVLQHYVYTLPFWIGSAITLILLKIYNYQRARWLDVHRPLPSGQKHYVDQMNRVWLAGLAAVLSLGWVLLTAQQTHDQTVGLARNVARCWSESYRQAKAQIDINAQNDAITRQQQGLQLEYDKDLAIWIRQLIAPPGDLAHMDPNGPERQAWGMEVSQEFQDKADDINRRSDDLINQRAKLDGERAQHPLPETTCGK